MPGLKGYAKFYISGHRTRRANRKFGRRFLRPARGIEGWTMERTEAGNGMRDTGLGSCENKQNVICCGSDAGSALCLPLLHLIAPRNEAQRPLRSDLRERSLAASRGSLTRRPSLHEQVHVIRCGMKPHLFHQNLFRLSPLAYPAATSVATGRTRFDASSDHPSQGDVPTLACEMLSELHHLPRMPAKGLSLWNVYDS